MSTRITLVINSFLKAMGDTDSLIEDKAFTIPQAFIFRHVLQIFQDSAFEVIDLFKTFIEKIGSSLFTANPPRTKHCYFFCFFWIKMFFDIFWKFTKSFRVW